MRKDFLNSKPVKWCGFVFTVVGPISLLLLILQMCGYILLPVKIERPQICYQQPPPVISLDARILGQSVREFGLDDKLLSSLYKASSELAQQCYPDAKLSKFEVLVRPYARNYENTIQVYFHFYSPDSHKMLKYTSFDGGFVKSVGISHANYEFQRVSFPELPWVSNQAWFELPSKAYLEIQQEGKTLTPSERTYYWMTVDAYDMQWRLFFEDEFSGTSYTYCLKDSEVRSCE